MYASDTVIHRLLDEMDIETHDPSYTFEPDTQIQPCSLDLRLGSVFWKPRRRKTLDLRRSQLLEVEPRRFYRRLELSPGQSIVLKPGQMVLARVYEKFTVPKRYAGEIAGRSSFARMGLMVHATGGFLNPGYRGHMTLQLVNLSANAIRLVPYLPICQLRLVRIEGMPTRFYGHDDLQSKYVDDDGGPSYWWRDKRIKKLHGVLGTRSVDLAVQHEIMQCVGRREPEVIERLERRIDKLRSQDLSNAADLLEKFASAEDTRRWLRTVGIWFFRLIFPIFLTLGIRNLFLQKPTWEIYLVWFLAVITAPISLYAAGAEVGEHLGKKELRSCVLSADAQNSTAGDADHDHSES